MGGGGGTGVAFFAWVAGLPGGAVRMVESFVLMNAKLEIFWGLPSCRTTKSSAVRSVTGRSLESVTIASNCTRLTLMRITASGAGLSCWKDCGVCAHAIAIVRNIAVHRSAAIHS